MMKQKTPIYKLKDMLNKIDSVSAWSRGTFTCYSCRRSLTSDKFDIPIGSLCKTCVESEFKKTVKNVDLNAWSTTQFMEALEALGNIRSRLTILWRFHEVWRIVDLKSPADVEQLKKLLVRNLGYVNKYPLSQSVRQAAFQACVSFGKSLTPLLISMCEPTPWQFYANVVMTLGKINPSNPDAHALIEKASKQKNPEIRKRAQAILVKGKSTKSTPSARSTKTTKSAKKEPSKQERLQTVVNKLNPSLRDLVRIGTEQKSETNKALAFQPIQIESPEEKRMEELVNQFYTADALKKIYKNYLHEHIFTGANFKVRGNFSVNKLKKDDVIRALAKVYANQDLFQIFFNELPKVVQKLFQTLVWEGEEREAESLEKAYKVKIITTTKKYRYGNAAQDLADDYLVFQVRTQYAWVGFSGSSYKYYLSLSDRLRTVFKHYLPAPPGYDLTPLKTINKTEFLYENHDRILKHIKLYYSYIDQGNLKFSQNTGKLLKSSLTQMAKYCNIEEFYDTRDKNLQYLKTPLIIDFLQGAHCETEKRPADLLRQLFQDFFQNKHPKSKKLYEFLYHLKGGYYEYHYDKREKRVKQSLLNLLKDLLSSQWVAFENLEKYCLYRGIDLSVTDRNYGSDLYFNLKRKGPYRSYHERTYVRGGYYKDAVFVPFLKTMMFLFATFGIVDIAYELPENTILQERDLNYLSPFDSLRYVRLTKLGAYVVGLTKKYAAVIEEETAKIELDTKRLIITIDGNDPLKTLIIQKTADKISENCYKVNYHSFLRECTTKKDIKQKVALFHEHIAAKPPTIWQEFLDDVLDKINPLVSKQKMAVFKLKQNKELISLVARDEVLKGYILKAEDYHILIPSNDIPKVKKRLEEFGYFIDNI